ncbi:S66 peptidase family protein [Prochlorococcus marinus]|uniref:Putative carboxypeptidase n=1 Tax=Prochlorococcus marinus (strain MIT 9211) TaxID=93059 RepID=A9BE77_PROM4|nr:LD-carboxypeptidase [Prochlorococcus marinus]ABX08387.1 Putative carboxypeptidase [Prochlorococcus marinus str. MIT 9211]
MLAIKSETIPKPLKSGDEVITIAASSAVKDQDSLIAGLKVFEGWGLHCREHSVVGRHWGYLAGSDKTRLNELHPKKSAALKAFARGGWGAARLLEHHQPWERGWLLGFSDVSSILLSRLSAGFSGGIHGPLITSLAYEPAWSKERLKSILFGELIPDLYGEPWIGGLAKGPLVACNLTVASHLLGSSHIPDLKGAILIIEDIGEEPYRVDRMLTQWRLAGLLQGLAGLGFGNFVNCVDPQSIEVGEGFRIDEVLKERSKGLNIPVVGNLPIGHLCGNAALPIGSQALLDGERGILRIVSS